MNILGIETSSRKYSLALFIKGQCVASRTFSLQRLMTSSVVPKIKEILKTQSLNIHHIDGFAVGLGPGGFTSLRVGVSTVKGLAFALQKPVVGVSSLDLIAQVVEEKNKDIYVIIDARRKMIYSALYRRTNEGVLMLGEYRLESIQDLLHRVSDPTIFVGDAIACYQEEMVASEYSKGFDFLDQKFWHPKAKYLLPCTFKKFEQKNYDVIEDLKPLYLYPDDCQVMQKK